MWHHRGLWGSVAVGHRDPVHGPRGINLTWSERLWSHFQTTKVRCGTLRMTRVHVHTVGMLWYCNHSFSRYEVQGNGQGRATLI